MALRPYILNKISQNNIRGNTIYFLLIIVIAVPLQLYKFTFTSIDEDVAKKLVEKVLTVKPFSEFKHLEKITWKPYDEEKKFYNIQANLLKGSKSYRLFLQPKCEFFKGCEVTMNRIMVIPIEYADFDINSLTSEKFEKRACSDFVVETLLLEDRLPNAIKIFFETMATKTPSKIKYKIESTSLNNYKATKAPYDTKISSKMILNNSCEATFKLKGNFSIINNKDGHEYIVPILKSLFDDVKNVGTYFTITSKIKYGIYITPKNEITIVAQPFNLEKVKKMQASVKNIQKQPKNKKKFANGKTDLQIAVGKQDITKVKQLIDAGHDINEKGHVGYTPLMTAAGLKSLEIVKLLVENGANINAKLRGGWSVLHRAAMSKNPRILKYLIQKGINMDAKARYGCTPMDAAFRYNTLQNHGSLQNAKTLIAHGMSVNDKCRSYTPLMISVGEYTASEFLIKNGADKSAKNQFGDTAYDMAKKQNLSKKHLQLLKP